MSYQPISAIQDRYKFTVQKTITSASTPSQIEVDVLPYLGSGYVQIYDVTGVFLTKAKFTSNGVTPNRLTGVTFDLSATSASDSGYTLPASAIPAGSIGYWSPTSSEMNKIIEIINGTYALDVTNIRSSVTPISNNDYANKLYVDTVGSSGTPDASDTAKGKSKLSVAPVSGTNPIAVGDNDTRVPIQSENDALVGTSGTPSSSNKYVTNDDTSTASSGSKVPRGSGGKIDNGWLNTGTTNGTIPLIGTGDVLPVALIPHASEIQYYATSASTPFTKTFTGNHYKYKIDFVITVYNFQASGYVEIRNTGSNINGMVWSINRTPSSNFHVANSAISQANMGNTYYIGVVTTGDGAYSQITTSTGSIYGFKVSAVTDTTVQITPVFPGTSSQINFTITAD